MDNMGVCRFHRGWAEDMLPEIIDSLYGMREQFLEMTAVTASRINSRNSSVFWDSERDIDFVMTYLKRRRDVEGDKDPVLQQWIEAFEKDKNEAALDWWCEMKKGIDETLRAFL
jgi:glyceraldehyde-3-phosphate dehydrogenase (ferredoxin)